MGKELQNQLEAIGQGHSLLIAELSSLYQISSLRFSGSETDFAEETKQKAILLFGTRRFALFVGPKENRQLLATWRVREPKDILEDIKLNRPNQFYCVFGDDGELGALFMEQAHPVTDRERRLYNMFAQRVEDGLAAARGDSERKLAEQALRQSEERYRKLVETAPDVIYTLSKEEGTITSLNPTFERITGWSCSEWLGKPFSGIVHPDDLPLAIETFEQALQGKASLPYELRILSKSGEYLVGEFISLPQIENGKIVGEFGIARDITQRKQQEIALRTERDKLVALINSPRQGVTIINQGYQVEYQNKAVVKRFGEPNGKLCYEHYAGRREPCPSCPIREAIDSNRTQRTEIVFRDGRQYEMEYTPFTDIDNKTKVICLSRDITERKKQEERIKALQELNERIINSIPASVAVVNSSLHIVAANRFFHNYFCQKSEKCLGRHIGEVVPINGLTEALLKGLKTGRLHSNLEFSYISPQAGSRIILATITPLKREEELLVILQDVTMERAALSRLYETNRLASVGRLASGVAHELNNPLTGVVGYAQLLMSKKVPEEIKNDLEKIHAQARRAAKVVENLLTFARRHKPERQNTDLNQLLERTLELRAYELKVNNIQVFTNFASDLPPTSVDPHQMQQVFLNIIINAEEAITGAHHRGRLIIETREEAGNIKVSFTDDGPGIPKEDLSQIFDPFFTTKETGKGAGLGLSICHGIVTDHDGRIYAESEKGKGATFIIELPIVVTEEADKETMRQELARKQPARRILVVDDEPAICDIIGRALTEDGHHLDIAKNGRVALQKLAKNGYDLCLIDLKMPKMGGRELYKTIGKKYPHLASRVLFITGDTVTRRTRDFLEATGCPHLAKPFDINELRTIVQKVIKEK